MAPETGSSRPGDPSASGSHRARREDPAHDRPDPDHPVPPVPPDDGLDPWLRERLFDQRLVMVRGVLTPDVASSLAGQLLALEAADDTPVRMHLACPDGDLEAAFALVDTVDLLRIEVSAVVAGEIGGAALAVLTAAHRRTAYPHARFRLSEPRVDDATGTADDIVRQASRHLTMLDDLIVRLAELTGKPRHRIENDLSGRLLLSAREAVEYGLVDDIVQTSS